MGKGFQKFVEFATDSRYVPLGSRCSLCGKRLGFFRTGFWSVNAAVLTDGALCPACIEKVQVLFQTRTQWMPDSLQKSDFWKYYGRKSWKSLSVDAAQKLLAAREQTENGILANYGSGADGLFTTRAVFRLEPTALDVGVLRAKKLRNKLVAYGVSDRGTFKKDDIVLVEHAEQRIRTRILEAYIQDCEENDLQITLRAHMGRQMLPEDKTGWLVLDLEDGLCEEDLIVKPAAE